MAVSDGQAVNATVTNSALASKSADNTLTGKQTLNATDSGPIVNNLQLELNNTKDQASSADSKADSALSAANSAVEAVGDVVDPDGNIIPTTLIKEFVNDSLTGVEQDLDLEDSDKLYNKVILTDDSLESIRSIRAYDDDDGPVQVLSNGYILILTNNTGRDVELINEDTGVTQEENRFSIGSNIVLSNGQSLWLSYNGDQERWNAVGGLGNGSGGGSGLNFISDPFELVTYRASISTVNTSLNLVNTAGNNDLPENTEVIYLDDGNVIGGLTSGNTYFLLNSSEGETQLSSTAGGSAINLTASGDGWLIPVNPVGAGASDVEGRITLTDTDDVDLIGTGLSAQTVTLVSGENCLGDGIKVTVPIASAYEAVDQLLSLAYDLDSTLDEGDIKLFVKDGDNTFVPLLLNTNFNNQADFYRQYFRPNASSIELVLFIDTDDNTASAREFLIDDYILKPAIPVLLNRSLRVISDSVSNVTSSASANFLAGPSITLPVGKWKVTGFIDANNNGSSPAYTSVGLSWRSANGANSATAPALLATNLNGNIARGLSGLNKNVTPNPTTATGLDAPSFEIDVTTPITIFLVPRVSASTIGNVLINAGIFAREVENESSTIEALSAAADLEILKSKSSVHTPSGSTIFPTLSGNSVTLKAGKTWEVFGHINYSNNGATGYTLITAGIFGANGGNNDSYPTLLGSVSTLEVLSQPDASEGRLSENAWTIPSTNAVRQTTPKFIVRALADTPVFVTGIFTATTPANCRITGSITARELPHTNVALYPKVPDVEVYMDTGNGHGSTDTAIRRLTNIRKNTAQGFVNVLDSAANGTRFEILQDGDYEVMVADFRTDAGSTFGISVNASVLTGSISSLTYAQGRRSPATNAPTGLGGSVTKTLSLKAGDIVRHHTNGANNGTTDNVAFSIKLISLR